MDKLKRRYELKLVNLSQTILRPAEMSIADACAICFVRFAKDQEMRYPEHYPHDFFQISIDGMNQFFPFRPFDIIKILPDGDRFHTLKYRVLRGVDGYGQLLICYDMCPDSFGRRPDITFPLKNMGGPEIHEALVDTAPVNIAVGNTGVLFTVLVPGGMTLVLWDFGVWNIIGTSSDFLVIIEFNAVVQKTFLRNARSAAGADGGHIEHDYSAAPKEFNNSALGSVNFMLKVKNINAVGAADFGGTISYSLVPMYLQNPAAECQL